MLNIISENYKPPSRAESRWVTKIFRFLWTHRKTIVRIIFALAELLHKQRQG